MTPITLHRLPPRSAALQARRAEPLTCGLPWPRGVLADPAHLALVDGDGRACPLQARALERWPDGSVRWALLDWLTDSDRAYSIVSGAPAPVAAVTAASGPLSVRAVAGGTGVLVDSGRARFTVAASGPFPFAGVELDGRPVLDVDRGGLVAVDAAGARFEAEITTVRVSEQGPVRVALELTGRLARRGRGLLDLTAHLHFHRSTAAVRLEITVTNPRAAGHPGGIWTLGSSGSVLLADLALTFVPEGAGPARVFCSPEPGTPLAEHAAPLELYQDSSGGPNWNGRNHANREGRVPVRLRGYRLCAGGEEALGGRATPIVALERGGIWLGLAMRHFWEDFPKAIEASTEGLVLRLFPQKWRDLHEIQGGERKTHVVHLSVGRDEVSDPPLDWCRLPSLARADPEWYAAAGAVTGLLPEREDPNAGYTRLVSAAIEGEHRFEAKREAIDEYGWRHFGDLWADHESAFHPGPEPLLSHANNQYDGVLGFALQFLRSGDERWYHLMEDLARHAADIDIYHTDRDRPAYNHGPFWPTVHYIDAGLSTHRTYPRAPGVAGGGPAAGNLYATGLALHHFLTGDPRSRAAVAELGHFVIDADDGRRTILRFLDRGPTGCASESGFDGYQGPGRTPGNAIGGLLDAHRLTGDRALLEKAEEVLRRSIHPDDDLAARNLGDAENRWFYTMFLQSLGRYLERKAELGELDAMYAYGRAALLHYARWAAEHEYPYLEKPEVLEYPTETWAAQDLRKCELLNAASRHAQGAERDRFRERARFFFDASVRQLEALPTRASTRPLVLLLTNGYSQAAFDRDAVAPLPPPADPVASFPPPLAFRSQKERAKRKLVALAAAGVVLAAAAVAWWSIAL